MTYRTKISLTDGPHSMRLIWITEEHTNKYPGISTGFFGKQLGNTHFTYHDNGLMHTILEPKQSKQPLTVNETTRVSIDDIGSYMQMYSQFISLRTESLDSLSVDDEAEDRRQYNKILNLSINDFKSDLNVDAYFVRRGSETEYLEHIKHIFLLNYELIGVEFINLMGHYNHRIAFAFLVNHNQTSRDRIIG